MNELTSGSLANISEIRFANLKSIIAKFKSKAEFCRQVGIGQPQLAQFFMQPDAPGYRMPGPALCRKVELALGLTENSLDQPSFQKREIPNLVFDVAGLSALHLATLEALYGAIKSGGLSDLECAQLLARWLGDKTDRS